MADTLIKLTLNDVPEGAVEKIKGVVMFAIRSYYAEQKAMTQAEEDEVTQKVDSFTSANK